MLIAKTSRNGRWIKSYLEVGVRECSAILRPVCATTLFRLHGRDSCTGCSHEDDQY